MLEGQSVTGGAKHVAYIEAVQRQPPRSVPYVPDAALLPLYAAQGAEAEDPMLVSDPRSDAAFRAWGSRRVMKSDVVRRDVRCSSAGGARVSDSRFAPGQINVRSLQRIARLPASTHGVDPVFREPARSAGGHTFLTPYHMQYQYYKRFGNAGCHDLTSSHHNFPVGNVPLPQHVYTDGAQTRVTLVRNMRQKLYACVASGTDRTFSSPLYSQ
jgi:hypothetical protein